MRWCLVPERPYAAPGARVREWRKRNRTATGSVWTQVDLAAWLGTGSQGTVSEIEQGKARPTRAQAEQLSEHAGIAMRHWGYAKLAEAPE